MRRNALLALALLCGCHPSHDQAPSGFISVDSASGRSLLTVDPAYGKPPIEMSATCTPLEDDGIRVSTDACGIFRLHPLTTRGPQDGLTSLDGHWEASSHEDCPLRTIFPDAWTLR